MLTLAMESSAKPASVAVFDGVTLLGQYFQNNGLTHSRTLMVMTDSLLKNLDVKISDIGLVAVSTGPGSFTGVRIGVSAAKGLAWSLDIPACGVSTLLAMAHQVPVPDVIICSVMDARRGQVYNALFEFKNGITVRLCDDRALSLESLSDELSTSGKPVLLIGDGADMTHTFFNKEGINCSIAPDLMRWQTAYGVALASINTPHTQAIALEPSYLRPSQAEREAAARNL